MDECQFSEHNMTVPPERCIFFAFGYTNKTESRCLSFPISHWLHKLCLFVCFIDGGGLGIFISKYSFSNSH